jgi:RNA polymerase sigma-70 factor (ECF subfamily)
MQTDDNDADDLSLASRVAEGDPCALETLYARYADSLFAFVYHRLEGSRPDAEEVWQDTWAAALGSLPTYCGRSRLFTWLCAIARRKIADRLRRRGLRAATFSELSPSQLAALWDAGPLPDEILARKATRVRVVEALAMLRQEYRLALVARYADQRSVGEVAKLLDKTYKATESLLVRARTAFRAAFLHGDKEQHDER